MHRSLRIKVISWFLFVTVIFLVAGAIDFLQLRALIRQVSSDQIDAKLDHIDDVLVATNSVYSELATASMHLLKMFAAEQGTPSVRPPPPGDNTPELCFGGVSVNGSSEIMDRLHQVVGGTAAFFVRDGHNFIRVSTSVVDLDGESALWTWLNPSSPAALALSRGEAFHGVTDIFGNPYLAIYEPIVGPEGDVLGATFVGFAIEALSALRDTIEDHRILQHGFFALIDDRGYVLFLTSDLPDLQATEALAEDLAEGSRPAGWIVKTAHFEPWGYTILAAMPASDIWKKTYGMVWQVYGLASLIVAGILVVSFWLAARLSTALTAAEISREEALTARDAAESANRTKSTFLANMSHELRTPMNAIIGYSEMLMEDAEDAGNSEIIADLEKISGAGKHLLALINDILDISKIEAGKMTIFSEEFDIPQVIREVCDTVAPLVEKNGNALQIVCRADLGTMTSDLTKVRQTLFNLLSNAAKFTEHGTITLTAEEAESGMIRIRVSDTGIGMTPSQMQKLFTAFGQADSSTTRKYGGTGLGLVISKKFCEMMGGGIEVTSEYGQGTTFTATLPRSPDIPEGSGSDAEEGNPQPEGTRAPVLVVDDDPDSAELLRRFLEKQGHEVLVANSGARALELAKASSPCAITLDVMMPGMDGWSVLSALKSEPSTAAIPVIMVTMVQDRQLGFALGASDYITKPVDSEKLRAILESHGVEPSSPVLVVEDDPESRGLLVRLLHKQGLAATEAANGAEALASMRHRLPAVVLLDLMMPVMDGFQFLEEASKFPSLARVPVIVVTAKDLSPAEKETLLGKGVDVVQKGAVNRDLLLEKISALVGSHARGGGIAQ